MLNMNNTDGHSFTQSSVMTYSNTGQGQPSVYQATSSTRTAPGGVSIWYTMDQSYDLFNNSML